MSRIIALIAISLVIIGVVIYYANNSTGQYDDIDPIFHNDPLKPLPCDLNKQSCVVTYKGKMISFSFKNKPLVAMQENEIVISNLPKNMDLSLKLSGINMNMGTINAKLQEVGSTYRSDVVLSACILTTMRYEAAIYQGDKPLGIKIKFDLNQ